MHLFFEKTIKKIGYFRKITFFDDRISIFNTNFATHFVIIIKVWQNIPY